jgi:kinesin family member 15
VIAQTREAKIARLESLMDGTLPTEEFMNEEYISLMNEHKVLSTYLFFYGSLLIQH